MEARTARKVSTILTEFTVADIAINQQTTPMPLMLQNCMTKMEIIEARRQPTHMIPILSLIHTGDMATNIHLIA